MVFFSTFTNISLLNIYFLWIELASSVMNWITKKFILKSSNILFILGVSYLLVMFILVVVGQNYTGAAMVSFGVAIIIILVFLHGGRLLSKKLEIRRPILVKRKGVHRHFHKENNSLGLAGEVKEEIFENRGKIKKEKGLEILLRKIRGMRCGVQIAIAPAEPSTNIQKNQFVKDEVLVSEGAKTIMMSAWIIAGFGWAYCCCAVVYSTFSENVSLGIVSALAQLFMCMIGICINAQVLRYISLSTRLSYHVKIQSSNISTG